MSSARAIGARLRHERQARGMSMRRVAQEIGVSPSLISQVETGKTQPSVATLYALASLLSLSVDDLLGLKSELGPSAAQASTSLGLRRAADNPVIEMENGVRWERLAMGPGGPADALLVTYQPGGCSSLEGKLMRHVGLEHAYILSGEITLQLEFDTYRLGVGDSVFFDSSRPHMFANRGPAPATGVWLVVGRREFNTYPGGENEDRRGPIRSAVEVLQRLDSFRSVAGRQS